MSALFFSDNICDDKCIITGEDALHIAKSLRMSVSQELTVCNSEGVCHDCVLTLVSPDRVEGDIIRSYPCKGEPSVKVTLYQALIKGDKMDTVIQKAVELGVSEIVPMLTSRCISRPDKKQMDKKLLRWQKISDAASMQSRRGKKVKICPILELNDAIDHSRDSELKLVFYEKGGESLKGLVCENIKSISVFVGSEGGFDEKEIKLLNSFGIKCATLGERILRTETAPLAALSIIMYITGNI